MTNAVCESYNKSWVDFGYCRLRAVSRTKVFLNINATILHPVNDVFVKGQLMKKANGYKPWLYSATFDGCQFIRRRNHPLIRLVWELFKEYSTINHTCPYEVRRVNSVKYYNFYNMDPSGLANGEGFLLAVWKASHCHPNWRICVVHNLDIWQKAASWNKYLFCLCGGFIEYWNFVKLYQPHTALFVTTLVVLGFPIEQLNKDLKQIEYSKCQHIY